MRFLRTLLFGLLVSVAILSPSCDLAKNGPCLEGSGPIKTEQRDVAPFNGIDFRVPGRVFISKGEDFTVQVKSYRNLLSEIETSIEGKSLVIKSSNCLDYSSESTTIYITMPFIENIEVKGSGEIQINNIPATQALRLNLSGSGKIMYSGTARKLLLLHSGSGDIELSGAADVVETTLSGSGKVLGYGLLAGTSTTTLTGSGEQQVWVSDALEVNITGSGNVYYRGTPSSVSIYKSGSGDVYNRN